VPVASIDLYPTLLDLAGITPAPGQTLDGISWAAALSGGQPPARTLMFWHFPCYVGKATPASAVRESDFKLIEFFEDGGHVELYNLREDPGEKRDLSHTMPDKARLLSAALHAWQQDTKAAIPTQANAAYDPQSDRPRGRRP